MLLYRIGKLEYANDLKGTGAKINGGRWNHEGIPCIYTSGTKSLCLLEYSAHISLELIPRALSFTTLEVPENGIKEIKIATLPGNWNQWPHSKEAKDFGAGLLKTNNYLIIKIPSAVIQSEFNYIINPMHSSIKAIKIILVEDYAYDLRIKN